MSLRLRYGLGLGLRSRVFRLVLVPQPHWSSGASVRGHGEGERPLFGRGRLRGAAAPAPPRGEKSHWALGAPNVNPTMRPRMRASPDTNKEVVRGAEDSAILVVLSQLSNASSKLSKTTPPGCGHTECCPDLPCSVCSTPPSAGAGAGGDAAARHRYPQPWRAPDSHDTRVADLRCHASAARWRRCQRADGLRLDVARAAQARSAGHAGGRGPCGTLLVARGCEAVRGRADADVRPPAHRRGSAGRSADRQQCGRRPCPSAALPDARRTERARGRRARAGGVARARAELAPAPLGGARAHALRTQGRRGGRAARRVGGVGGGPRADA
eukprot:scaffold43665_cov70-Phaeocystis_antarctica.AAC.3